ncbi:MAG: transglycosylase SLT domain-containing protein [bacterium]
MLLLIMSKSYPQACHGRVVDMIDSLIRLPVFQDYPPQQKMTCINDGISIYPDIYYEYKLEELNKKTPVNLEYNDEVLEFIEIFTVKRKKDFEKIAGLARLYFPLMDEMLDLHNLPLELKYLAVVESGLNPLAVSPTGATGLWQFKINSARMFNLEVNSYIDERRDPLKSTRAACKYLTYLYSVFNNWQLAIGAYNGGPGVIRNAIERSGGKTSFNEIKNFLPEETREYIPAFIAAAYVMNHLQDHGIEPVMPAFDFLSVDTVMVNKEVSFSQVEIVLDIRMEFLRFLNPVYKKDFIPDYNEKMMIVLPADKVIDFIRHENDIYGRVIKVPDYHDITNVSSSTENKFKISYIVKKGDFLHKIAMEHGCTLENLKIWNNLTDNHLYPGQKMIIWIKNDDATRLNNIPNDTIVISNNKEYLYHD